MPEENNNTNNIIKEVAQDIKKMAHSIDGLGSAICLAARTAVEDIKSIINSPQSISENIKENLEENRKDLEIEFLKGQVIEARKQTKMMRVQNWCLIGTLIVVAISFILDIIFRLKGL